MTDRAALKAAAVKYMGCSRWEAEDVADHIIDLALEEAAKVADALEDSLATEWRNGRKCDSHLEGKSDGAGEVAAAIRALKEKP
jgi:lactate dehydrogenase-like 2-hydroxyacid dehydrogenase